MQKILDDMSDGIGNAFFGELAFENGVPTKTNFDKYELGSKDKISTQEKAQDKIKLLPFPTLQAALSFWI